MKFEPEFEIVKFNLADVIATSDDLDWGSHDLPLNSSDSEIIVLG